jgi:hypothetical protein
LRLRRAHGDQLWRELRQASGPKALRTVRWAIDGTYAPTSFGHTGDQRIVAPLTVLKVLQS